jgi:superfamily II helicase
MTELKKLIAIYTEVTNLPHKAQTCAVCGRKINRHEYKGRVFRVQVRNDYDQYSDRHACWSCVRKVYERQLREMPRDIADMESEVQAERRRLDNLMTMLGVKDKGSHFKSVTAPPAELKVREV